MRAVFESWRSPRARRYREIEGIDEAAGTAVTVQAMVFGNLGDRSGTGVAFSRDPATGTPGLTGDFLPRAQGEDVVAGGHSTLSLHAMAEVWPDRYAELERIAASLERTMADMVDLEFTIEDDRLWMLQARRAKRSPIAALRCAIDMAIEPGFPLDRAGAVARCQPQLESPPTVGGGPTDGEPVPLATGLPASPGRATGVLCLDPDEAVEREAAGEAVVLVRRETSPADVHGMAAAVAIFTLRGGLVSHAAVVAHDWGLPAVVGAAEASITEDGLAGPGGVAAVGSTVTVDGDRGVLLAGAIGQNAVPAPEVETLRRWAEALESSPVPPSPGTGVAADVPFDVLHGLRVKGMADAAAMAARTGSPSRSSRPTCARSPSRDWWSSSAVVPCSGSPTTVGAATTRASSSPSTGAR